MQRVDAPAAPSGYSQIRGSTEPGLFVEPRLTNDSSHAPKSQAFPEVRALVQLLKPVTWFPPMWAFLCGAVSAGVSLGAHWMVLIAGVVLAGPLVCGGSQIVNDWYDRHVDSINEPDRPIPSGRVPGSWAFYFAISWSVLALLYSVAFGPIVFFATSVAVLFAWAYSAPPVRLKRNGWLGNAAVALSYEGLAWVTGAAIVLDGTIPDSRILVLALVFSVGAHGIMTLNDFKSVEGDLRVGLRSLPAIYGPEHAARMACWTMALAQLVAVAFLLSWGFLLVAGIVSCSIFLQLLAMRRLLSDPKGLAPWYNGTGVVLYVLGMMISATALHGAT
ncbi:MAG: chlorophyll synthase ChlG [Pseudomonadota bacterium]